MILLTASCKESAKMSTVIHCEGINRNNYTPNCYVYIIRIPSAFCKYYFGLCLNFQRVFFRAWIFSTRTEQRLDLRHSRISLPVHWNGMLRNSRSQLAVATYAATEMGQMLMGVDAMEIGAWTVCRQHLC
jgi:hypothetical protein